MKKTPIFAIIGALLGIPLSYYFQPDIIQAKLTLSSYLSHLPELLADDSADFVTPVILSVFLCAFVMGIVGYFMDQASKKKVESGAPEKPNPPEPET